MGQYEFKNELEFESALAEYLENVRGTKQWEYRRDIKTIDQLWQNFKEILEQHNQQTLDRPLSREEFNQVKKEISSLHTPYQAGQFLYGVNGVSQIEVDLDDGRHVYLTVFDQKQVGAGDTVYQVVTQVKHVATLEGKKDRRYDTTLLINGLPVIQIEEKHDSHDVNEALNQMEEYIHENQYSDIFSTIQILIAMTPNDVKYMANTTKDLFNKDFAFRWQKNTPDMPVVRHWRDFADQFLSIPMAHQMATNYMILDGTKNKQKLIVMRPYQVYATQAVIEGIKKTDFDLGCNKVGYVWHTTGSGKTITSFKTAWLASRLPNVDKVVFVVDRIDLTSQTQENYQAYDPDGEIGEKDDYTGMVSATENTRALANQLKSKSNGIVVTSFQKLGTLVQRKSFKSPEKNIVFIVDEAHRSTGGDSFAAIQKAFKRAAWVGYTGTPMFDDTTKGLRTADIFGGLLHAYTIKNAISDGNVLGFKVDFKTTIDEEKIVSEYLPTFYAQQHPDWSQEQIADKIANLIEADYDDQIEPSFYDDNLEHVKLVVKDIFDHWQNRSADGRYNALLTTRVGGQRSSIPMAMMYYKEFQRVNQERQAKGEFTLKVGITFSAKTDNKDGQAEANNWLHQVVKDYDKQFGTTFSESMDSQSLANYRENLQDRLKQKTDDGNYLDLVIVVEQLLTGFDAPKLNTLYVDRTLKGASLVQAYSRTNRIADNVSKPWGNVINYRWPRHNENLMNEALAIYADENSANLSPEERKRQNQENKITVQDFRTIAAQVRQVVTELRQMTDNFEQVPRSEKEQEVMLKQLRAYNAGINKLQQFTPEVVDGQFIGFDYDKPDEFLQQIGLTPDESTRLTVSLANDLKHKIAKRKHVPFQQIDLKMTHIKDVEVNYDYLTELIERLLNQVHEGQMADAKMTKEAIYQFANSMDDQDYAGKVKTAADTIYQGDYQHENYPVRLQNSQAVIEAASKMSLVLRLNEFRHQWGLLDVVTNKDLQDLFYGHVRGTQDLKGKQAVTKLQREAQETYQEVAGSEEVRGLTKIKYRNRLLEALHELADRLTEA